MSSGGKGPAPQASYIDPVSGRAFWTSDQLNEHIAVREAQQAQETARVKAEADAKRKADLDTFNSRVTDAYTGARSDARRYMQDYGVDPEAYDSDITNALDRIRSQIIDLSPNPAGAFANNVGADILTNKQAAGVSRATGRLDEAIGPNFSRRAIGDDLAITARDQILGEQFSPLMTALDNAKRRGALNDGGYSAALNALNQRRASATSSLDTMAGNALTSARGSLEDLISGTRSQISRLRLPALEQFDPSEYVNEAQATAARLRGGFGNRVREAVGNTRFADLTELLNAGGVVQGPTNAPIGGATATPDLASLASQVLAPRRSLGSQGAF